MLKNPLASMQPYIFPNLNYYRLAITKNFIFLDDVNFIKKGFINRNAFYYDHIPASRFTLPVNKISQNRLIADHFYLGDFSSLENKHKLFCSKDKYYEESRNLLYCWMDEISKKDVFFCLPPGGVLRCVVSLGRVFTALLAFSEGCVEGSELGVRHDRRVDGLEGWICFEEAI